MKYMESRDGINADKTESAASGPGLIAVGLQYFGVHVYSIFAPCDLRVVRI